MRKVEKRIPFFSKNRWNKEMTQAITHIFKNKKGPYLRINHWKILLLACGLEHMCSFITPSFFFLESLPLVLALVGVCPICLVELVQFWVKVRRLTSHLLFNCLIAPHHFGCGSLAWRCQQGKGDHHSLQITSFSKWLLTLWSYSS